MTNFASGLRTAMTMVGRSVTVRTVVQTKNEVAGTVTNTPTDTTVQALVRGARGYEVNEYVQAGDILCTVLARDIAAVTVQPGSSTVFIDTTEYNVIAVIPAYDRQQGVYTRLQLRR